MAKEEISVQIINYSAAYKSVFRQLNLEWLDHYGLTESHDLMVLDHPEATIIQRGGFIYLAVCDGEVIGSAALMKEKEGVYELAKMAVAKTHRGKGISKMLMEQCLLKAKEMGAQKLTLFSNHQLTTAVSLYRKYGFKDIEVKDSPFTTADVKMELLFN